MKNADSNFMKALNASFVDIRHDFRTHRSMKVILINKSWQTNCEAESDRRIWNRWMEVFQPAMGSTELLIRRGTACRKGFENPYNRIWYKQDAIGNIEILFFIWLDKDLLPGILTQDLLQVVEKYYRTILSRGYITIAVLTSLVFIIAFAKIKVNWNTVTITSRPITFYKVPIFDLATWTKAVIKAKPKPCIWCAEQDLNYRSGFKKIFKTSSRITSCFVNEWWTVYHRRDGIRKSISQPY